MNRYLPSTTTLLLICACAWGLAGCEPEILKVGAVLPLTGSDQAAGEAALQGLELAVAELEATGEHRLELLVRDSGGDPAEAGRLLEQLFKEEKAVAAIGGLTPLEARALAEVAEEHKRILILPTAGDQRLSEGSKHVYRISVSDAISGSKLASFARSDLKTDTAVVLAEDPRFAETLIEGFQPTFENLRGKLIDHVEPENGDLAAAAQDIRSQGPDAVVLSGGGAWLEQAVHSLRDARYRGKIMAPQGFANPATLAALGEDAQGVLFTYSPLDSGRDAARSFVERFESTHGEAPSLVAAEAYDSLQVLLRAAADRPAIPDELRRGLRDEIKDYPGVTGSIEFDDTGAAHKFPRVYSLSADLHLRDHEDLVAELKRKREDRIRRLRNELAQMGSG